MAGYLKITLGLPLAAVNTNVIAKVALFNLIDSGFDCMRQYFDDEEADYKRKKSDATYFV